MDRHQQIWEWVKVGALSGISWMAAHLPFMLQCATLFLVLLQIWVNIRKLWGAHIKEE